jgi:hypothetical protein
MFSPFHTQSTYELPPHLSTFLETREMFELSCINRSTHSQIKQDLHNRKKYVSEKLIKYFYCNNRLKKITIAHRYDDEYYKNVRLLFQFLPELFQFIYDHQIVSIDLSCLTSYGGYPECPSKMIGLHSEQMVKAVSDQLLNLVSTNQTLLSCNLGLFEWVLECDDVHHAIEHHPMMEYLSIRAEDASAYFSKPPTKLYRNKKDNTFYWAHFRNNEDI